jgi:hypothetical protein
MTNNQSGNYTNLLTLTPVPQTIGDCNGCDPIVEQSRLDAAIIEDKTWRTELDAVLQKVKAAGRKSRERCLVITKIQEGIMWLGMDLKDINDHNPNKAPNPYPGSYDPSNKYVAPTADGLKL